MKVKSESEVAQSCLTLVTPWTAAYQAPPSMGFSRQKYLLKVLLILHGIKYFFKISTFSKFLDAAECFQLQKLTHLQASVKKYPMGHQTKNVTPHLCLAMPEGKAQ